jgi:hypothetical protein
LDVDPFTDLVNAAAEAKAEDRPGWVGTALVSAGASNRH